MTPVATAPKRKSKKVSCADCYFHKNTLCALDLAEPCPTFRPAEHSLRPPQQLNFVFRERRTQTLYAFRSPN